MRSLIISTLCLAASVTAQTLTKCSNNNCLRAVIGNAHPTRSGSADCASYLRTTVTPATSTITETETESFVESTTLSTSTTETFYDVSTSIVEDTSTSYAPTSTTTVTEGPPGQTVLKRQVTVVPSNLPLYATACDNNPARYSSACSCIGVTAETITVAAPSTTETETVSETETIIFTESFLRNMTITTATVTQSATVSTTVITPVATETVYKFVLRVQTGTDIAGKFVQVRTATPEFSSSSWEMGRFTDTYATATIFYMNKNDGLIWHSSPTSPTTRQIRISRPNPQPQYQSSFWFSNGPWNAGSAQLSCAISATGIFTCDQLGFKEFGAVGNGPGTPRSFLLFAIPGYNWDFHPGTKITIKALPVPV